jgi:CubicO group peptidase (beta-lactamase class C family)
MISSLAGVLLAPSVYLDQVQVPEFYAQGAGPVQFQSKALDPALQSHIDKKDVAGIEALVFQGGKITYHKTFGWKDVEKQESMSKDGIFRMMSMTKPVMSVAALVLMDEGKFKLDDPISNYLPEWKSPQVWEDGKLVPAKQPITPRMLMSHSSGLYYGKSPDGQNKLPTLTFQLERQPDATLKRFSEEVAKLPLQFQPGEGYQYGVSIDILGRYVEAVAKKPADEFLKERIFAPLKMVDTDFYIPTSKAGRLVTLYSQPSPGTLTVARGGKDPRTKPAMPMGGHGLMSTTADYSRFCEMILNGGELDGKRILKSTTVDQMFENHLKTGTMKYGLGGAVDGNGGYSWGGANGTQFWIDRKSKLFALFMVQTQGYRTPAYATFRQTVNQGMGGDQWQFAQRSQL